MKRRPALVAWSLLVIVSMAVFAWNSKDEQDQIFAMAIIASGLLVVICEKS